MQTRRRCGERGREEEGATETEKERGAPRGASRASWLSGRGRLLPLRRLLLRMTMTMPRAGPASPPERLRSRGGRSLARKEKRGGGERPLPSLPRERSFGSFLLLLFFFCLFFLIRKKALFFFFFFFYGGEGSEREGSRSRKRASPSGVVAPSCLLVVLNIFFSLLSFPSPFFPMARNDSAARRTRERKRRKGRRRVEMDEQKKRDQRRRDFFLSSSFFHDEQRRALERAQRARECALFLSIARERKARTC